MIIDSDVQKSFVALRSIVNYDERFSLRSKLRLPQMRNILACRSLSNWIIKIIKHPQYLTVLAIVLLKYLVMLRIVADVRLNSTRE